MPGLASLAGLAGSIRDKKVASERKGRPEMGVGTHSDCALRVLGDVGVGKV